MPDTIIDRMYQDNATLQEYLREQGEYLLLANIENSFPKMLLLAIASYFEDELKQELIEFFQQQTSTPLLNFVKSKAIERQYHTYFAWKETNANQFFSLFGRDFRDFMKAEIQQDEQLAGSIRAFMEIGRTRNALVHENFATFSLQKTAKEIYELYQQAMFFVEVFPQRLREYSDHSPE
jgi:hypothetical protein